MKDLVKNILKGTGSTLAGLGMLATVMTSSGCAEFIKSYVRSYAETYGEEQAEKNFEDEQKKKEIENQKKDYIEKDFQRRLEISEGSQKKSIEQIDEKDKMHIFTCNYWADDFIKNDAVDYPQEFHGKKHKFKDNEKVTIVYYNPNSQKGQKLKYRLYSPKKEKIEEDTEIIDGDGETIMHKFNFNSGGLVWKLLNYGRYEAVYSVDGKNIGSTEFEITK